MFDYFIELANADKKSAEEKEKQEYLETAIAQKPMILEKIEKMFLLFWNACKEELIQAEPSFIQTHNKELEHLNGFSGLVIGDRIFLKGRYSDGLYENFYVGRYHRGTGFTTELINVKPWGSYRQENDWALAEALKEIEARERGIK